MARINEKDSGYAWAILAAVVGSSALSFGGTKAFGVFYVEFLQLYGGGSGATAWVASFSMGLMLAFGFISTWLCELFSARRVMMVGGVVAAVGHLASAYVTRMELLYLTYGLLTGIGRGMCFAPSLLMVNTYFKSRRALANGMAFAGSGVGSLFLPFLTRYLIDSYGLSGALVIMAGITMNMTVFGALMRPVVMEQGHSEIATRPDIEDVENKNGSVFQIIGTENDFEIIVPPPTDMVSVVLDTVPSKTADLANDKIAKSSKDSEEDDNDYRNNTSLSPISDVNIQADPLIVKEDEEKGSNMTNKNNAKTLKYPLIDVKILKHPLFLIFEVSFLLATTGYLVHFIMLPAHAVQIGFSKPQADFLLSVIGMADIAGRIGVGWFSDLNLVPRKYVFTALLVLGGVSSVLIPFTDDYILICLYAAGVGILPGSGSVIIFVLMTESLGPRMTPSVFGIHSTLFSIPALIGPPVAGWLEDWTGSWDMSFRLTGSCMIASTVISLLVEPCVRRRMLHNNHKSSN